MYWLLNRNMKSLIKAIILRFIDTKKVIKGYFKDLNQKRYKLSLPAQNLMENGFYVFYDILNAVELQYLRQDFSNLKQQNNITKSGQDTGRICANGLLSDNFKSRWLGSKKICN